MSNICHDIDDNIVLTSYITYDTKNFFSIFIIMTHNIMIRIL